MNETPKLLCAAARAGENGQSFGYTVKIPYQDTSNSLSSVDGVRQSWPPALIDDAFDQSSSSPPSTGPSKMCDVLALKIERHREKGERLGVMLTFGVIGCSRCFSLDRESLVVCPALNHSLGSFPKFQASADELPLGEPNQKSRRHVAATCGKCQCGGPLLVLSWDIFSGGVIFRRTMTKARKLTTWPVTGRLPGMMHG
ncbi:hypothetical protein GQ53DRAFT_458841 [Thozetella sp. PMI_491]|nr:hypothetical protein GQ53DRAFT_458841 [Thozetella sp. PMI_491]